MPDLFKAGELDMSTVPLEAAGASAQWADCVVNHWAVVVAVFVLVLGLPDLIRLIPHLLRCMPMWKGNIDIEHSVSTARTRNYIALAAGLVLCILADRWGLVAPTFKLRLDAHWHLLLTAGLLAGTVFVRYLAYLAAGFGSRTSEFSSTLRHALYNYVILLTALMLLSVVLMLSLRLQDAVIKTVMYIECAVFYIVHLVRISQIFRSRYGSLATILYLCALEILPVGILIFVCTL